MPIMKCKIEGLPGLKFGESGKCYLFDPDSPESYEKAKANAEAQGRAMGYEGGGKTKTKEGHRMSMNLLRMVCHDLVSVLDMIDGSDLRTIKSILQTTHDRYALLFGDPSKIDVDVEVEPGHAAPTGMPYEAVDEPTSAQRSNLPAAAYFPADFKADESGGYSPEGIFRPSKSRLPHHINTVDNPDADGTVDVPRLRNALARFDQVDWSGFPAGTEGATRAHLEKHADAILYQSAEGTCKTCRKEEADALRLDVDDFRNGRFNQIRARQG